MKHILRTLVIASLIVCGASFVTSCDDGGYWWPDNNNTYLDSNLIGSWQLIQINEMAVTPNETNYLRFFNNGTGYYYYLLNGNKIREQIGWICMAGYNRDTISIRYQDGRTATMNYWFSGGNNYLYLNWNTSTQGTITYCYRYVTSDYFPW